jgi:hypothetical protein
MSPAKKKATKPRPSKATGKRRPSLRPKRGDAQKAAVIALLLEGCSPTEIEKKLKIPESTVRNWKRELTPDQLAKLNEKRAGRLDEMLWDHLESNFAAMKAITTHVQSKEYIQGHDPDAVAVLYGVINDKNIRVLDAIERARGGASSGGESDADRETA